MGKLGYFFGGAVAAITLIAVAAVLDSTPACTGSDGSDTPEGLLSGSDADEQENAVASMDSEAYEGTHPIPQV